MPNILRQLWVRFPISRPDSLAFSLRDSNPRFQLSCAQRESNPHDDQSRRFELRTSSVPSWTQNLGRTMRFELIPRLSQSRMRNHYTTSAICVLTTRLMHIRTIRLSRPCGLRRKEWDLNPRTPFGVFCFRNRRLKPLGHPSKLSAERMGFEPMTRFYPSFRLANGLLQPLEHLSKTLRRIEEDSNLWSPSGDSRFPSECIRPLCHLSI